MPVYDWSRVDPGILHHFHQGWLYNLAESLNRDVLPSSFYVLVEALVEQHAGKSVPDLLTLHDESANQAVDDPAKPTSGRDLGSAVALAEPVPAVEIIEEFDESSYARQHHTIAVRHTSDDRIVARFVAW
jgi:hypothetical protein